MNMKRECIKQTWTLKILLVGMLVGLIGMGCYVGVAQASPDIASRSQENSPLTEGQDCQSCHINVTDAWQGSPHDLAYTDPIFQARWKALGEPGDCLVCHTTDYQATSGEFSAEGVTCEACHGQIVDGHPPAIMPIHSDTEYCGICHPITLGEWRLTGHSTAGVGCTNCHNPHSQQALYENPDEMCINCHKDDMGEHMNDVHIQKGIGCFECHALVIPPDVPPDDGLVPTGHSFTITPATCVACHTDVLKSGNPIPGYEQGAKAVAETLPTDPELPSLVATYTGTGNGTDLTAEQQIQTLSAALASTRLSTLFQGGIVGLVLGGTTMYFLAQNRRRNIAEEEEELESDQENPATAAGDGDESCEVE
jgi:predicted CXXCH cytochrome family protein